MLTEAATIVLPGFDWWQGLVILIGALGLSPAPWILGLAFNRIQFTKTATELHDQRVAELKEGHARELDAAKASAAVAVTTATNAAVTAIDMATKHHQELSAAKDAAYAEMRQSRDYYREARLAEQARANAATDQLADMAELAKANLQALRALDEVVKEPSR